MSTSDAPQVRATEVVASLALATDLGTGQPLEHGLRTCLLSVAAARALGVDDEMLRAVHGFALLRFLGCTSDAQETASVAAGDEMAFLATMAPAVSGTAREQMSALVRAVAPHGSLPVRARRVARALTAGSTEESLRMHCEVGVQLGRRLGCPPVVLESLAHAYERWDGKGYPDGLAGEAVPLPVRLATAARDVDLTAWHGWPAAEHVLLSRRGAAYDPQVVDALLDVAPAELDRLAAVPLWEEALAAEPVPHAVLGDDALDEALTAVADFADLKNPHLRGHSRLVARLAEAAGRWCGVGEVEAVLLRRAGLVHDIGRVAVPCLAAGRRAGVEELERDRLHPYFTERVLARCDPLRSCARVAGAHHERVDGAGYPRGLHGTQLDTCTRLLAAADVLSLHLAGALGVEATGGEAAAAASADVRAAHRGTHDDAAAVLARAVDDGGLDGAAAEAVLNAWRGADARGRHRSPAALTGRETEVLRLLTRGRTNRQIADELHLSPKTIGRHVDTIYAKTGTHSRAAAAVYALEHGMTPDGA